ncbi:MULTISPECIES: SPOR domain-containing protein [Clostridium]|uniref:SPOR domain-containing protein n=1 Tax=Clostridium senegalense TaxID=1465809 RepID=A0A6M0GY24_9CLOT|nr:MULTISPECIES: SPOR domain-containing protein [Clostridium]NEU03365.1 SPOR domain-containing protein [Clostridium senegalense]
MKYTRYDVRPKRKRTKLFPLIVIIFFCVLFSYLILDGVKGINIRNNKSNIESKEKNNVRESEIEKSEIVLLQCGVFKVKDNADKILKELSATGSPFVIEDNDLYKIYYGMYKNINESEKVINTLEKSGINTSKNIIKIYYKDLSMIELAKIIEAELDIINNAMDPKIKSVKTTELKKWVSELDPINENHDAYKEVNELKEHINKLPEEVDKSKASEMNSFIYNQISKFKEKQQSK